MVVRRYFYVDIDPISRQVAALRMIKPPWFLANTIGKPIGVWPTFVSFPIAHAF
jgi:hypothetical protein